MNSQLLSILVCPETELPLRGVALEELSDEIISGNLITDDGQFSYPIVRSIPRFVPAENYASGFGYQWNKYRLTQLDSHTGLSGSEERLCAS